MQPLYLFGLASRHSQWASVRQAAIAGNIANANTPGYKAVDAAAFDAVLNQTQLNVARTSESHLAAPSVDVPTRTLSAKDAWGVNNSGNSVSIEQEMMKANEVNSSFTLDTTIVRTFNRMILASLK
ncbi:flagellar basal body rod protein FlgB [Xanthobacter agilis]|jgi:flagellar basal-body rod protein FlgB|uniref:Flagellar basal body rod protein FlgB n=1 Tax=Xanthobacter agilis TaxID=47492 RepID=A0ABU0LHV5_XANAG|nr:flagellar basal body rod protein FlgB [Xanthobacter agilis]MDQ0506670.1 flagellar basal-body rod protein FlgB [Xanthobacter agilis]